MRPLFPAPSKWPITAVARAPRRLIRHSLGDGGSALTEPDSKKRRPDIESGRPLKNPGNALLSRGLHHSTIAAGALNGRVRNGNACFLPAMITGKKANCIEVGQGKPIRIRVTRQTAYGQVARRISTG